MTDSPKVRFDLLLLIFLFSMVAGYALASPFRLLAYFYTKPFPDYLIISALFAASTFFNYRWVRKFEAYRIFLLLVPAIAFVWLRLDYALYAESYAFNMVSYAFVILLGLGSAGVVEIITQNTKSKPALPWFLAVLAFGLGMVYGWYDQQLVWMPWLCFAFFCFVYAELFEKSIAWLLISSLATLGIGVWLSTLLPKPVFFESQKQHHDKVVFSQQTRFQQLDITEWKGNQWFYQDGINHFSTIDSWLYFEPFVQPVMHMASSKARVLIIGGENGMIASALQAFGPASVDLLPVDGEYLEIASTNPYYTQLNEEIFAGQTINIIGDSAFRWLFNARKAYDVIFVDVPDPIDIELNQYYTLEFYRLAHQALAENGVIVTQSGSPYFATAAFQSIEKTMAAAEFSVTSYHNQVLTLGEWGWTMGMKADVDLKSKLWNHNYDRAETQWFNQEAMRMMLSFGKPYETQDQTAINTLKNPVIHRLYNQGNYQLN